MSDYSDLSIFGEDELLHKHRETGDAGYFGELYNRYIPLIYGVCLKYLPDAPKAQKAVVQLFEELLPKISDHEIKSFRTWLYDAVKNHCTQAISRENATADTVVNTNAKDSDEILNVLYDDQGDKKRPDDLQRCIERLPDKQRICITHFFLKKMSYIEIVEKTGYSMNTVKTNIRDGKRNLTMCLNKNTK